MDDELRWVSLARPISSFVSLFSFLSVEDRGVFRKGIGLKISNLEEEILIL